MADPSRNDDHGPRQAGDAGTGPGSGGGDETNPPADPVELGVALLERLEHAELSVADAIDRIEAITSEPSLQRKILDEADRRGVIEREGTTVRPQAGFLRFESEVVEREGEFECERCGAGLSTGYFVKLDPGEVGPFGSSCIRRVVGRE